MDGLLFRMRVAVLWVAVAIALMGSMLLPLFEPEVLEGLLVGEYEGQPLDDATRTFIVAALVIPLVMVAASLLVSERVNCYLNLVTGFAFGLFGAGAAVMEVMGGHFDGHVVMVILATVFLFLVAGLGVVGLRQPSSPVVTDAVAPTRQRIAPPRLPAALKKAEDVRGDRPDPTLSDTPPTAPRA